jgi:hypothetical protein
VLVSFCAQSKDGPLGPTATAGRAVIAAAGDGEDPNIGKSLPRFADRFQPLLFRHEDIGDDGIHRRGVEQLETEAPVARRDDFESGRLQHVDQHGANEIVVVDHQEPC